MHRRNDKKPANWAISEGLVPYEYAEEVMKARAAAIAKGEADELVWLLEHAPLYTAGTSADPQDLIEPNRFPVHKVGRGGQYTYHGPGQRVAYVMLDLQARKPDLRAFVNALEQWIIDTLAQFNIDGERRDGRVGIWLPQSKSGFDDKIAALGIRVHKWVTYHGISVNIDPDLSHFDGIVPCGIEGHGVTSFEKLGQPITMPEFDMALRSSFENIFGATNLAPIEDVLPA